MAQSADADYTNAISGLGAGCFECLVSGSSCTHQRAGVDALDGLRNKIGKPRIYYAIVAEGALVEVGESEPTGF
jgi:hypothetical protein